MARFYCHSCRSEGTFSYCGKHKCPQCDSDHVQFALTMEDLGDDHPPAASLADTTQNTR